jgi:tetratricopeptide (TPR) repeat protein
MKRQLWQRVEQWAGFCILTLILVTQSPAFIATAKLNAENILLAHERAINEMPASASLIRTTAVMRGLFAQNATRHAASLRLGEALALQGDFRSAAEVWQQGNVSVQYLSEIAWGYLRNGRTSVALSWLAALQYLERDNPAVTCWQASGYYAKGDIQSAATKAGIATSASHWNDNKLYPVCALQTAAIFNDIQRPADAIALLTPLLSAANAEQKNICNANSIGCLIWISAPDTSWAIPSAAIIYYIRGLSYLKLERSTEAIEDFEQAVRLNPSLTWARQRQGIAWLNQGDTLQANQQFTQAIASEASWFRRSELAKHTGYAYLERKDYSEARFWFQESVKHFPDSPSGYYTIALTFYQQGDYNSALTYIRHAVELSPDNKDFQILLDDVLQHTGNTSLHIIHEKAPRL